VTGRSDRWDAVLIAGEIGLNVWQSGPHRGDVLVGLGLDVVKPFKDEEVSPSSFNVSLGANYRLYMSDSEGWFVQTDGRIEVIGNRNTAGDNLGGQSFSVRIGLGVVLGKSPKPRLQALGQGP